MAQNKAARQTGGGTGEAGRIGGRPYSRREPPGFSAGWEEPFALKVIEDSTVANLTGREIYPV
jgi:hypothetical protein